MIYLGPLNCTLQVIKMVSFMLLYNTHTQETIQHLQDPDQKHTEDSLTDSMRMPGEVNTLPNFIFF